MYDSGTARDFTDWCQDHGGEVDELRGEEMTVGCSLDKGHIVNQETKFGGVWEGSLFFQHSDDPRAPPQTFFNRGSASSQDAKVKSLDSNKRQNSGEFVVSPE